MAIKIIYFIIVGAIFTVLLFAYGARNFNRDGLLYKAGATFIAPISQNYVTSPACTASSIESTLEKPLNGWRWFHKGYANVDFRDSGLLVSATQESLWFKNANAFSYYCAAQGDFSFEVLVKTRKSSDPLSYPDSDFQFGGIIVRNPASNAIYGWENYVFNVLGHRGRFGLQVETKTTRDGVSSVNGSNWLTGDASLKIERKGSEYTLWARPVDGDVWEQVNQYVRKDIPNVVEVGLIVYSTSWGVSPVDINVEFSNLKLKLD